MAEDRVDIPRSWWERFTSDRKRVVMLLTAVAALLFIGTALGVRLFLRAEDTGRSTGLTGLSSLDGTAGDDGVDGSGTAAGSETTRATEVDSGGATSTGGDADDAGDESRPSVRAPRLAYRLGGAIYVADEDGGNAVKVATSERGDFALSPDGATLAWVDASSGTLHLTDIAPVADLVVGDAEDVQPAWSSDSSYIAYTAQSPTRLEVRRVGRDGRGGTALGAGHSPAVSPDGLSVAYLTGTAPGAMGRIVVKELTGAAVTLESIGSSVIFGGDGLIYSISSSSAGSERIMTSEVDGAHERELIGTTELGRPVIYTRLRLAPDGKHLMYAATGDDGFSRGYIAWLSDPSPITLTVRRDTYPMRWSADGSSVYFIEGNAFQGERTSLMSATSEGLGRHVVVDGAGL